jgi:hypothetical protein
LISSIRPKIAFCPVYKSLVRVVVRLPMTTSKISSTSFRKVAVGNKLLQNMCIRYNEMLLTQGADHRLQCPASGGSALRPLVAVIR